MSKLIYLNDLPKSHPNRNRSLVGVWYRWKNGNTGKEVKPTFKIAHVTFNDLGPAWTDNDLFTFERVE